MSTAVTGVLGPRKADGSLPDVDFLKLKAGSPLIDKGTDVMLPFVGAKPDLGADEFGAVAPPLGNGGAATGGAATGGAAAGSGGAPATAGADVGGSGSATSAGSANGSGGSEAGPAANGGSATGPAGGSAPGGSNAGTVSNPGASAGTGSEPNVDGAGDGGSCSCRWKDTPAHGALLMTLAVLGAALRRRQR